MGRNLSAKTPKSGVKCDVHVSPPVDCSYNNPIAEGICYKADQRWDVIKNVWNWKLLKKLRGKSKNSISFQFTSWADKTKRLSRQFAQLLLHLSRKSCLEQALWRFKHESRWEEGRRRGPCLSFDRRNNICAVCSLLNESSCLISVFICFAGLETPP